MASYLKSDIVSKSYDMGPHVKLMGNLAVGGVGIRRRFLFVSVLVKHAAIEDGYYPVLFVEICNHRQSARAILGCCWPRIVQLDCRSARRTQKSICQQTRRAMTILRPLLESSRRGEFRSSG